MRGLKSEKESMKKKSRKKLRWINHPKKDKDEENKEKEN